MMMMMLVNPPSLSLFAEVSSERSPRRRSISGLGSSEKSVAVDNPNTSPFKVPVSNGNTSHQVCAFIHFLHAITERSQARLCSVVLSGDPQSTEMCRLFAVYHTQAVHKAEFLLPAGGAKV